MKLWFSRIKNYLKSNDEPDFITANIISFIMISISFVIITTVSGVDNKHLINLLSYYDKHVIYMNSISLIYLGLLFPTYIQLFINIDNSNINAYLLLKRLKKIIIVTSVSILITVTCMLLKPLLENNPTPEQLNNFKYASLFLFLQVGVMISSMNILVNIICIIGIVSSKDYFYYNKK